MSASNDLPPNVAGATVAPSRIRYRDAEPSRRKAHRFVIAIIGIVVLVVAVIVGDIAFRAYAENVVSSQTEASLPPEIQGQVDAQIGGTSAIIEYLTGKFETLDLEGKNLSVSGVPIKAVVVAKGVPVNGTDPIDRAAGTVSLSQDAVKQLVKLPDATSALGFGDGTVSYTGSTRVLGKSIDYEVTAVPSISGKQVILTPTDAKVTSDGLSVDAGALIDLIAPDGIAICAAQYHPESVTLSGVEVAYGEVSLQFTAANVLLTEDALSTLGSC